MIEMKRKSLIFLNKSYNKEELKYGRFCATLKQDRMIDVMHQKCKIKDCNIRPSYNKERLNIFDV